jgi:hypothetical protein
MDVEENWCRRGAVQTGIFGRSIGGGKNDRGCDDRETAMSFALLANRITAAKILCGTPAAKRAHPTIDDCLAKEPQPDPIVVRAPAPQPQPEPVPLNAYTTTQNQLGGSISQNVLSASTLIGVCSFARGMACAKDRISALQLYPGVACKKMFGGVIGTLNKNPDATLQIIAAGTNKSVVDASRSNNPFHYLAEHGVSTRHIQRIFDPSQTGGTVELWLV